MGGQVHGSQMNQQALLRGFGAVPASKQEAPWLEQPWRFPLFLLQEHQCSTVCQDWFLVAFPSHSIVLHSAGHAAGNAEILRAAAGWSGSYVRDRGRCPEAERPKPSGSLVKAVKYRRSSPRSRKMCFGRSACIRKVSHI